MTAEEFLAEVDAHRVAREKERLNPKPVSQSKSGVRVYYLDPTLVYTPKRRPGPEELADKVKL
ncbi:MAG: hypothetical protein KGS61_19165 [Verrucomicrobia bacterium]|nr:hypothetical protein [Verrucomicrobiota bacterium]